MELRGKGLLLAALLVAALPLLAQDGKAPAKKPVTCERKAIDADVTLTVCSDGSRTFSGSGAPAPREVERVQPAAAETSPAPRPEGLPSALAGQCVESSIVKPIPLLGRDGEVLAVTDGSHWEVRGDDQSVETGGERVTLCPGLGVLIVDGKPLNVVRIACHESELVEPEPLPGNPGDVVALLDGSRWEVQPESRSLGQSYLAPTICPARGVLFVGEKRLNVVAIP